MLAILVVAHGAGGHHRERAERPQTRADAAPSSTGAVPPSAGGITAGALSTYARIAAAAEAVASSHTDRPYFARVKLQGEGGGKGHGNVAESNAHLWADPSWVRSVLNLTAPASRLPWQFRASYSYLRGVLGVGRSGHTSVSNQTVETLGHCVHQPLYLCGGKGQKEALGGCTQREVLSTRECGASAACRRCACGYLRQCGFGFRPDGVSCHQARSGICQKALGCIPMYVAAAAVCGSETSLPVVDRLLLTGLAYDVMHGDDESPNGFGLNRSALGLRLSDDLAEYMRTDGASLANAIAETPRRIRPPLVCPAGGAAKLVGPEVAKLLEPLYPTGRNLFFHEVGDHISFVPYRPLPSIAAYWRQSPPPPAPRRVVLVDVGANGFFASPKRLIDLYEHHLPFTDVYLIEPDDSGMLVPPAYQRRMKIHFEQRYVGVGTRSAEDDLLVWLADHVSKHDYVVLKFDVDEGGAGSTIEWGFLSDLYHHAPALALIDELYIELHFEFAEPQAKAMADLQPESLARWPNNQAQTAGLQWQHQDHSMSQHFDVLREMRRCGVAVHAWP